MKKIFFLMAILFSLSFASCKPNSEVNAEAQVDSTEVKVDSTSVDSVSVDTTAVDTTKKDTTK
jgi:hypothetical protein